MGELNQLVRVSPLVIVPSDELDEFRAKLDTGISIEVAGSSVGNEVLGHEWGVDELNNSSHISSLGILDSLADVFPGGLFLELDS